MEVLLLEEQPIAGVVLWFSHSPRPPDSLLGVQTVKNPPAVQKTQV